MTGNCSQNEPDFSFIHSFIRCMLKPSGLHSPTGPIHLLHRFPPQPLLKPSLHLGLDILQRPITPVLRAPGPVDLFGGEALGLGRGIVSQSVDLADLGV